MQVNVYKVNKEQMHNIVPMYYCLTQRERLGKERAGDGRERWDDRDGDRRLGDGEGERCPGRERWRGRETASLVSYFIKLCYGGGILNNCTITFSSHIHYKNKKK